MKLIQQTSLLHNYLIIAYILLFHFSNCNGQSKINYGNNKEVGKYFKSIDTEIYYEVYGNGKPLILLHGNGGSISGRAYYIEEFSKTYKVIAIDSRCHGNSGCPDQYLTYTQMASDVARLLDELKFDSTYIWGHSDGGIIGLIMAIKYPNKVSKLLTSGANLRPDSSAVQPELINLLEVVYNRIKNDSIAIKQFKLLSEQPNILTSDLKTIKCSVLVMAGDRDAIRNEHSLEIFNSIPNSLLCILPGTTHFVYSERKEWFTKICYDFFDHKPRLTTTAELLIKQFK